MFAFILKIILLYSNSLKISNQITLNHKFQNSKYENCKILRDNCMHLLYKEYIRLYLLLYASFVNIFKAFLKIFNFAT